MKKTIAVLFTAALGVTAAAAPASATTDKIVGNNAAAQFWFQQTTGDCEEAAFDTVYGLIKGTRMHESTVVNEAIRLGVLSPDTTLGSSWGGPDGLPKLAAHYGIKLTLGAHKLATIEADLAAGDIVVADVNSTTIWNYTNPGEYIQGQTEFGDHVVVVDSIDETAKTVTLTDSGPETGRLETVPLSVFNQSAILGGWNYGVVNHA